MVGSSAAMGGPCAHTGTKRRNGGGGGNGGLRGVVPWRPYSCALERREEEGESAGVGLRRRGRKGAMGGREEAPCALP
jgi:hypothetical protein